MPEVITANTHTGMCDRKTRSANNKRLTTTLSHDARLQKKIFTDCGERVRP